MSPLESLRRFQIDCGDVEQPPTPLSPPVIPPVPLEPTIAFVSFEEAPPELPPPPTPEVALTPEVPPNVPPLVNVPTTPVEIAGLPPTGPGLPSVTPEPGSFLLVLTGATALAEVSRRKRRQNEIPS